MTTTDPPPPIVAPAPAAPTLDYANPDTRNTAPPGQRWMVVAVSLALGVLGANAFADAAGFPPVIPDQYGQGGYAFLRVLCGVIVFLLSLAVITALLRGFRAVVGVFARTPERPGTPVALTTIICGTACILATLIIELLAMRSAAGSVSMNMVGGQGRMVVRGGAPLSIHLASAFAFLAGAALIAIGVWSSLGRGSRA